MTFASAGDHVTPQSVLGYVGTSGNAQGTAPHLHFGVSTSTGAINPLPLLAGGSELVDWVLQNRERVATGGWVHL